MDECRRRRGGCRVVTTQTQRVVLIQQTWPAPVPKKPPAPASSTLWCDASNYTGPFDDQQMADLKNAGYVGVIIQAITGLDGKSYATQQLAVAARNGLRLAGYLWCFTASSAASVNNRLMMFDGYTLEFLALDAEAGSLSVADVDRDLTRCDAYWGGVTWLYSGKWFFDQQGWSNDSRWSTRPLWDAHYDGIADPDVNFVPYGGWTQCQAKQFQGTSSIGSLTEIDLNVIRGP